MSDNENIKLDINSSNNNICNNTEKTLINEESFINKNEKESENDEKENIDNNNINSNNIVVKALNDNEILDYLNSKKENISQSTKNDNIENVEQRNKIDNIINFDIKSHNNKKRL